VTEILKPVRTLGARFRSRWATRDHRASENVEPPLRSELFSVDQLRQHAMELAARHQVSARRGPDRLLPRLAENERVLLSAYHLVTEAVQSNRGLQPAGEWLLDNFYLVEEQIRTARRHLPRMYSKQLPRLTSGSAAGYPRVYDIALELISHVDGRIDAEGLRSFVAAYQTIMPLKLGELWAIPIMLRLALIENLRRVAAHMASDRVDRDLADSWADRMLEMAESDPQSLILVTADMARSKPPMSSAFVAELQRRLHGHGPALTYPLTWIEQGLADNSSSIEQLIHAENQQQAADQVSIGNSIGSLRFLDSMDWRDFVEELSVVEQTLRTDPAGVYMKTDFATRDACRHVVERTAKHSLLSERDVARGAIELARGSAGSAGPNHRTAHVGFYLVDDGVAELEERARVTTSLLERIYKSGRRYPLACYLGSIVLVTLLCVCGVAALLVASGASAVLFGLTLILSTVASSQLAVALVNQIVPLIVRPRPLTRMDYSKGIPSDARSLVAVPTLLVSPESIHQLEESLEVCYLANRDEHLHFALLTDFRDGSAEIMPGDAELLGLVRQRIESLNEKYKDDRGDIFFLFHRGRLWNPQEQVWMGRERKRGKLGDLNGLLRGKEGERFSLIVGETANLRQVKYVITLDTDTQLPRDAARQLVATLDHPLTRPVIDAALGRVCEGYGVLQPRVATSLVSAGASWLVKIFGGEAGIDPYTRVVSDVYQDVFREGSFIGKGIYDVDAFEQTLEGRFPDNLILSHDLLEGCYVRSGLVSDVMLFEDYPSRYLADVSRRHRWIRGDWQIAHWVLPRVPAPGGGTTPNPLSLLSRWKIFDNLRRSLVPAAQLVLLLLAWVALAPAGLWTLLAVATIAIPFLLPMLMDLRKPEDLPLVLHWRGALQALARHAIQLVLTLAFLPHTAVMSTDAVIRTLVRLLITQRRLLEWRTASDAQLHGRTGLLGSLRADWYSPAIAGLATAYLASAGPEGLRLAGPILALWFVAPAIAWFISRPIARPTVPLAVDESLFLHRLARRTWRFFETFVGPEDNWLPPDNYQEHPVAVIAHRTSPTNIGLSLLANLAAYDFGYVSAGKLIARTTATFRTLQKMERYQGHLFNWYDTRTLAPILPRYISTVDSGNFVGHLLVLQAGLTEVLDDKIVSPTQIGGLADTIGVLVDVAAERKAEKKDGRTASSPALARLERLVAELHAPPVGLSALGELLQRLSVVTADLAQQYRANPHEERTAWADALDVQAREYLEELHYLAPWLSLSQGEGGTGPCPNPKCTDGALCDLIARLDSPPTLREVARLHMDLLPTIDQLLAQGAADAKSNPATGQWLTALREACAEGSNRATKRIEAIENLLQECADLTEIDYGFLYDRQRNLLTIGYNLEQRGRDPSFYDLLASEARLCSFVGIAQGALPQDHWFALGRLLTTTDGMPVLLSWSGSMFEYLMPMLVMPTYENTLLDQTCRTAVERQIEYGRQRAVPWGMSESGYNVTDAHLNYQYRAFGVPGLGFKRGLAEDLVVAPYASLLALMVAPHAACANLRQMAAEGFLGPYGFYEAIDYTPSRVPVGQSYAVVRSFMAHHQGMSLLGLAYRLLDRPMQRRFESSAMIRASELLLQERIPKVAPFYPHSAEVLSSGQISSGHESMMRVFNSPQTAAPEVHLLSNGRYHVMVTNAGGGYSRWKDTAVTRWDEDGTRDNRGLFCYLRDTTSGDVWSPAYQPTLHKADVYEAIFTQARAEFHRRDFGFDVHTDIAVSPEDDIEVRRLTITNRSRVARTLELTSYAEVVLTAPAADISHPAFSNLFVQTEIISARQSILATRRPRSSSDQMPWMMHLMATHATTTEPTSYETDRSKFLGRGGDVAHPLAIGPAGPLSGSQGSVLDPIVAIRSTVSIDPDESIVVDIVTGIAASREAALGLAEKYHDRNLADRVFDLAFTHGQVMLQHLNVTEPDAQLYGRLASAVIYSQTARRAPASLLFKNRRGQSGLWGYGISGDLPIVLLRISEVVRIDLVRQLVRAHGYWRSKGLAIDLVIWNEDHSGYRQELHDQIMGLITAQADSQSIERPGGIFLRRADQMPEEDRVLLESVARVILSDSGGTFAEQVERRSRLEAPVPTLTPIRAVRHAPAAAAARGALRLSNDRGGFSPDGREYVITTSAGSRTPAPWSNVLANANFGTVVSESGCAYTWSENAHEFRLTPWYNDPVTDASGEAFYVRDEETGRFWSPTPLPAGGAAPYVTRHGFGYSVYEGVEQGIRSEMTIFVALDAPVKFVVLKLKNETSQARRLSLCGYVEWVLGESRSRSMMHTTTEIDAKSGALFARNHYSADFGDRIAFFDVSEISRTVTGDRAEFVGRNGTLASPAALSRVRLSGKVGAALDPCGAMQVQLPLAEGQQREVTFILGAGQNVDDARALIQRFRGVAAARTSLEAVKAYWKRTLGALEIQTPDESLNLLANGWLVYQTLVCRLWARSGYYQSGGAFGFRDQLQDVMALVYAEPRLAREHLLRASEHQFREGDVQHWWHPPKNRGVRTHFSDDFLWLPVATCRYVQATGDTGVLDERTHYIEGRLCKPDEEAYYDIPTRSEEIGSLYEHCLRAIQHGLKFGEHGLPLMGCGDWNDGMNLVGVGGKGESVWLAFFLYDVLRQFAEIARGRGDLATVDNFQTAAAALRENIETHAWDGGWYLRAYFDDGTPLGSATNSECQIDSLPQSWSVLSTAGDRQRSVTALDAVDRRLVRRDAGLIQLFDPPFDHFDHEPGYIKGYVPGVRENGGQYTHAAIWTIMAMAELGDQRAWELLRLVNPLGHGAPAEASAIYKVEPYVVAADVYAVRPHVGRGGWTWYTGSAGWMYRLIVESLLGMRLEGDRLHFVPLFPPEWNSFVVDYRYHETPYHITVVREDEAHGAGITVDGTRVPDNWISLVDDHRPHTVEAVVAPRSQPQIEESTASPPALAAPEPAGSK
jgi:cellobiose phosphorylase